MEFQTILELFYKIVDLHGECLAVSSQEKKVTYKELNEQSNKLAHLLIQKGISVGDFVGIYLERNVDTVISILGILKAGGAYVPLDPKNPFKRNQYIIKDTNIKFIISDFEHMKDISKISDRVKVLTLKDGNHEINVNPKLLQINKAYIIYTSGTTGKPKGVIINHGNLLNISNWIKNKYQIKKDDRLLQFASFSFDASVMEIFPSLISGSCIYITSNTERISVTHFLETLNKENISIIPILPTVFFNYICTFFKNNKIQNFSYLRIIGIGGEQLNHDMVSAFIDKYDQSIDLYNLYGPTETTVITSYYKIPQNLNSSRLAIPIGKPIDDAIFYIVDTDGHLCKTGEIGELWIASKGVSGGYLNKQEQTNIAFIDNPFEQNKYNGKLYKSGDLVRMLPDRNLEFIARKDTQVKIRGHRMELGEIEFALRNIEGIEDAVVVKEEDGIDSKLKAFYTSNRHVDIKNVMKSLKESLPSYMVPNLYRRMDTFPLNSSNKVDRQQLEQEQAYATNEEITNIVEPRNEIERQFIAAWRKILQVEKIGVQDDFFDIGGHSLKVLEVLVALRGTYPQLTFSDFYEYKTIENLAQNIINKKHDVMSEPFEHFIYLDEKPYIYKPKKQNKQKTILLTGSTGFLGSYILRDLIEEDYQIYLLIRGGNPNQRLQEKFHFYFNKELDCKNISIINGDITKEYLGIGYQNFLHLAKNIDSIIHAAADVRYHGDLENFQATNITGTKNMLSFLDLNERIEFHHISTLAITEDLAIEEKWDAFNAENRNFIHLKNNVYTQTKLAAENLVLDRLNNREVFIYRMGNLVGASDNGNFQENIKDNAFYGMIRSMILLNKAIDVQWQVDFTPIDFASQAVVKALSIDTSRRIFHICHPNPIPYKELIYHIINMGYDIELLPVKRFEEYLFNDEEKNQEGVELVIVKLDRNKTRHTPYVFMSNKTLKDLGMEKVIPEINKELIENLIQYGQKIGYF
ncbi:MULTISPECIES: amino acid adenylation domain-containing protein [Bacillus cereus group]|uniref:amino acid adenylation domain-containing protein n=1 Tax=Bacillus cereus group TaxID=86661 RepID=UPI001C00F72E|nr:MULTISPECIES: amino acid adenylation domain-containing protein [Bacillus cereus group]